MLIDSEGRLYIWWGGGLGWASKLVEGLRESSWLSYGCQGPGLGSAFLKVAGARPGTVSSGAGLVNVYKSQFPRPHIGTMKWRSM